MKKENSIATDEWITALAQAREEVQEDRIYTPEKYPGWLTMKQLMVKYNKGHRQTMKYVQILKESGRLEMKRMIQRHSDGYAGPVVIYHLKEPDKKSSAKKS